MTRVVDGAWSWRKSSWSSGADTCVELAREGAVRDSKNPGGPVLVLATAGLVDAVKAGALGR
jgi:hypothetical protein